MKMVGLSTGVRGLVGKSAGAASRVGGFAGRNVEKMGTRMGGTMGRH